MKLQSKLVKPSDSVQHITKDDGYDYLSSVVVEPVVLSNIVIDGSINTFDLTASQCDGFSSVTVKKFSFLTLPTLVVQSDDESHYFSGTYGIVKAIPPIHTDITIKPSATEVKTYTSEGKNYYHKITFLGINKDDDPNLKPNNVVEGETILGVEGTFHKPTKQEKRVYASLSKDLYVYPDPEYECINPFVLASSQEASILGGLYPWNIVEGESIGGVIGTMHVD